MRISLAIGVAAIGVMAIGCSHDQSANTSPLGSSAVSMQRAPAKTSPATNPRHEQGIEWDGNYGGGLTVTATVGPAGGSLSIPQTGVTLDIPEGALVEPTAITISAHMGRVVAYDFSPHGLTFLKPLTLTQKLSYARVSRRAASQLRLGYYPDSSTVDATGADISEWTTGALSRADFSFAAPIWHFSGYMVATGRSGL